MIIGSVDVETTKIPRHRPWIPGAYLINVGIAYETGDVKQYLLTHTDLEISNQRELVAMMQEDIDGIDRVVGHNLKFDLQWLRSVGVKFGKQDFYCTQVADYLLNGQRKIKYTLEATGQRYGLPHKLDRVKMFWDAGYETDEVPINTLQEYQAMDCLLALGIYQHQVPRIKAQGQQALISLQMELMELLSRMEAYGVGVDSKVGEEIYSGLMEKVQACEAELKILLNRDDLNLNSTYELSAALFGGTIKRQMVEEIMVDSKVVEKEPYLFTYKDPRKAPVTKYRNVEKIVQVPKEKRVIKEFALPGIFKLKKQEEDKPVSTAKDFLSGLKATNSKQEQVLNLLSELSSLSKSAETLRGKAENAGILNKVINGVVHPSFNQCIAATGRLTSSDPNGQNLPRKGTSPIKEIFVPRLGLIGNADLSQLEWTVAVWQSQDPVGIQEILDKVDQHRENAIAFFDADPSLDKHHPDFEPKRTVAKVFQFRLLYGGSAYGMEKDPNMPRFSLKKWKEIVEAYEAKYCVLTQYQRDNITKVHDSGGWLQIPSGRLFHFTKLESPGWDGSYYEQAKIKNYPTQGFATGDITPMAMKMVDKAITNRGLTTKIMLQVHDSIVMDIPPEEVDIVAKIVAKVFDQLPQALSNFFGINFDLPLRGEFEVGPNYKNLTLYEEK